MSKTNSDKQTRADTKPSKIPKFDLAEEIMAEQRKVSAVRRKGPGPRRFASQKEAAGEAPSQDQQLQAIGHPVEPPPLVSEAEQIIAEIVTRDIQKLCGDDTPSGADVASSKPIRNS